MWLKVLVAIISGDTYEVSRSGELVATLIQWSFFGVVAIGKTASVILS